MNKRSILKACSIRMFYTSFDRQFISYLSGYSLAISCYTTSLPFSCLSQAFYHSPNLDRLMIFSDFSEQFEQLFLLVGKFSSWLVSDLSRNERLLGSIEENVYAVETCWVTPLIFFLCSLRVPQSDSSSLRLCSALSIASNILFSMRTPRKQSDLHTFLSNLSRGLSFPFYSFLLQVAAKSSQSTFNSVVSTISFYPAQQQKSEQIPRICLQKSINLGRKMVRHFLSPAYNTRQLHISWMGNYLESVFSQKLSNLMPVPSVGSGLTTP